MSLAGKTILITGAAGGLGSALALQCASLEADLVLLDKNRRGLGELSDRITRQGRSVTEYRSDSSSQSPEPFSTRAVRYFFSDTCLVKCLWVRHSLIIFLVRAPGFPSPTTLPSTFTTGMISAAVPVKKHSSAV